MYIHYSDDKENVLFTVAPSFKMDGALPSPSHYIDKHSSAVQGLSTHRS